MCFRIRRLFTPRYVPSLPHIICRSLRFLQLTLIVGLEETYHAKYQHLYDFGMDFLTLFLDTVTPFWRTYGKTIGEDIRDFLIVPLYRNEFTGEPKRYPITRFPARSARHWVCLLSVFVACGAAVVVQARTAWGLGLGLGGGVAEERAGVRWVFVPLFWAGMMVWWGAVLVEGVVVVSQVGMSAWWAGWLVGLWN